MQIGTPLKRVLSGGQKRRLDSAAAQEVVTSVAKLARKEGIIVIASIHQPSHATLNEFTRFVLLSSGQRCFKCKIGELETFLLKMGVEQRPFAPPTDSAMQLLNTDFQTEERGEQDHLDTVQTLKGRFEHWEHASPSWITPPAETTSSVEKVDWESGLAAGRVGGLTKVWSHTVILGKRMALNHSRNILAYGIRAAMYAGEQGSI
ncbi:hypothetical protein QFC21_005659 [Naganishia friedmannii]|uniref:Uncharacterized protein n=1 Tax=Naganishia friedmannii TaxID=89922 RepID=A0ACC2V837_9TREE|nr:hypothetical protein QFC21_005659 [Naganishia friedmannii]